MFYAIHARSQRLHAAQRFLDEDELKGRRTTDQQLAQRKADAFAERLNQRTAQGVADWRGEIELINSPFKPL